MFSIFRLKAADTLSLLDSRLYDERGFYKVFFSDIQSSQKSVVIESPYLTVRRCQQLADLARRCRKRGVVVRVNTREPVHHNPRLRQQAELSIPLLKQAGIRVFVCSDYRHRKLAIIDDKILWEGSLNILSQSRSREIMRRTVSVELVRQIARFTKLNRMW